MRSVFIPVVFIFLVSTGHAQTEEDKTAVRRAMLDYIEGFYEGDSMKITRSISPEVVKYGYWKDNKTGLYGGEGMSYKEMIAFAVRV
ncbi:MAG: hypothetical protein WDO71_06660 [Bacteroidota bacterium]